MLLSLSSSRGEVFWPISFVCSGIVAIRLDAFAMPSSRLLFAAASVACWCAILHCCLAWSMILVCLGCLGWGRPLALAALVPAYCSGVWAGGISGVRCRLPSVLSGLCVVHVVV